MSFGWLRYQPAVKVLIGDILGGEFEELTAGGYRYFRLASGRSVAKVRIMGVVIDGYLAEDGGHARLSVDDGTGPISLRAWEEGVQLLVDGDTRSPLPRGTVVDVVGKPREWRGEKYVQPMIVIRVEDPNVILLRELEILRSWFRRAAALPGGGVEDRILSLLREEGPMREEEILARMGGDPDDVLTALNEMLSEGLIYVDEEGRYALGDTGGSEV